MNVFLIGFMGSGKTSIGKVLAKQLNLTFIDVDSEIEQQENLSITEIFSEKGGNHFRELEQIWLQNFKGVNTVISVGGGTPCFFQNITLMQNLGILVYLKLPVEMMANRVLNSKQTRPLIEPFRDNKDDLLVFMSNLLTEREIYYKQADIIFEASNMTAQKKFLLEQMINQCANEKSKLS